MFPDRPLGPLGPGGPLRPSCPEGPWSDKQRLQQEIIFTVKKKKTVGTIDEIKLRFTYRRSLLSWGSGASRASWETLWKIIAAMNFPLKFSYGNLHRKFRLCNYNLIRQAGMIL